MKEIEEKINLCKEDMFKKFPNAHHTVKVLLWDDGDYQVTVCHGDNENLHNFTWYSQEPEVKYKTDRILSDAMIQNAEGKEFYVPMSLIPYLQETNLLNLRRKEMYLRAYLDFLKYSDDAQENLRLNIHHGICVYFEKTFGVNIIFNIEEFPELKGLFSGFNRDKWDGNIWAINAEGAKIRADVLLKAFYMSENDNCLPSCGTCYYSGNGKHSCDRHVNELKPDYSKGVECAYNNYIHYRPYKKTSNESTR